MRNFGVIRFSESVTIGAVGANARPVDNLALTLRNAADTAAFSRLCDFGDVLATTTYSCQYRLKVTTSARSGYSIQSNTSGGLADTGLPLNNAAVGSGGSGGTPVVAGSEVYGVTITGGTCTNGTLTIPAAFNAGATNAVRFNHTTATTIASCSGPNVPAGTDLTNTVLVNHRLSIAGDTPAGIYTQSVTWTLVPNY